MEYKVGDKVKIVGGDDYWLNTGYSIGDIATIIDVKTYGAYLKEHKNNTRAFKPYAYWKEIEKSKPMSKYQDLKERIEAVTGWDKAANDIINELTNAGCITSYIKIWQNKNCADGGISIEQGLARLGIDNPSKCFTYDAQCEKLEAFKKALTWLLDHSDIKKDIVGTTQKVKWEDGKTYKVEVIEEL